MALYTVTVETIINNLCADRSAPIADRVESARTKIFDFSYTLPAKQYYADDFKQYFETAFLHRYMFEEIGSETVGRFKQRLNAKLLEIIPRYYLMFETLNRVDFEKLLDNTGMEQTTNNSKNSENNTHYTGSTNSESKSGSKSAGSSLPENILSAGQIGNFTNVGYADTGAIARTDEENSTTTENTGNTNSTEQGQSTQSTTGRNIMQFDFLRAMNGDFNKFFENFLDEFKPLFMLIYY